MLCSGLETENDYRNVEFPFNNLKCLLKTQRMFFACNNQPLGTKYMFGTFEISNNGKEL